MVIQVIQTIQRQKRCSYKHNVTLILQNDKVRKNTIQVKLDIGDMFK